MSNASRSESRDDYIVRVAAIHTTEGGGTAAALRDADWWAGSAHAIFGNGPDSDPDDFTKSDDDEVTPLNGGVPYDRAAWTLRSGNRWSVNAELIGYARWSRAEWLARWRQLNRVALWLADMHKRFNIPLQKITARQYKAGTHGVIGHIDHTEAYGAIDGGDHWDPGPGFPYDVVLAKAKQYLDAELEPNLTPNQAKQLDDVHHILTQLYDSPVEGSEWKGGLPSFIVGTFRDVYGLAREVPTVDNPKAKADIVDLARWANDHGFQLRHKDLPEIKELLVEVLAALKPAAAAKSTPKK